MPPLFGPRHKEKSAKYALKLRNQIKIKKHVEEAYANWHFSIVLISLKAEVAQISNFLVHDKILLLWKAFST